MGLRINLESDGQGQPVVRIHVGQGQTVSVILAFKTKLGQQRRAVCVAHDQSGLAGKAAGGLGTDRQVGVFVQHAAGDIDLTCGLQGVKSSVWGSADPNRSQQANGRHVPPEQASGDHHLGDKCGSWLSYFTAPRVRPAIKCFCIKKNIATGGRAATIDPALIR